MVLWATLLLAPSLPLSADEMQVPEVGISITVPNGWMHDAGDAFGFVIKPPGDKHRVKMRIHKLGYSGMTPARALEVSLEKINATKAKQGMEKETMESSEPVMTRSGINGQRGVIGPGAYYIDRYYFAHPDGGMFCVCVYKHPKWPEFGKECEEMILGTMRKG